MSDNDYAQFEYKVSGGNLTLYVVLLFAVIVGLLEISGTFKLLPVFG